MTMIYQIEPSQDDLAFPPQEGEKREIEIPEPPFERLPKHFLLQGSPALESLSFPEFENFLDEKEYKMLKIKICNIKYDDFYMFETENLLKAREIVARENSARGWEDDDCYSEIEGEEKKDEL